MNLIELSNITKTYHPSRETSHTVLKNIDLKIKKEEFLAIMGPSGSGKSTLMHIIGLLDRPTKGEYLLAGKTVSTKTSDSTLAKLRQEKIGFVFQSFNLLPRTSVLDNVMLPLVYSKRKDRRKRALEVLKQVELGKKINSRPNELSGGEQQRVAIARALVNQPEIILADEPTGNLDTKTGLTIMKILKNLNTQGTTVVLVTHEKQIADFTNRTINLKDGEII